MATADLSASAPSPSTPDPVSPGAADGVRGPLDPDGRPRFRLGPLYLTLPLANIALMLVWLGVGGFLVPLQVTMIKGHNDPNALKNAVAVGAALAAVGNPIFGQISDRTRSRFGRRAPWLLLCAVVGAGALLWQANAKSIGVLAIAWGTVQFILNGFQAALTTTMPDRVPPAKYARFSAMVGLATPIATIVAATVIGGVDGSKLGYHGTIGGFDGKFLGKNGYYLIAGVLVVIALLFVFLTPDKPSTDMVVEPFSLKRFVANFWVDPRRHPDFAYAFVSRFGVVAGYFMVQVYNLYILMEYIKVKPQDAPATMGFLMVVNSVAMVAAALVIGRLVDAFGRMKPFVLGSGVLAALSLFIPMLSATVSGMTVFNVVNGLAFGMYMAVDMALITKVLPRGEDAGKDMGLINIANAAPQVAAPFLASWIVTTWGYHALFPICGCVALAGAAIVTRVKSVR
ncbi:MFS family permease [Catenulispora sp. EB89]|uniref:MFS transporter n=1 Tax=Catenulispora sp. EB89 TaxID=3156257 RepID=UPI003513D106